MLALPGDVKTNAEAGQLFDVKLASINQVLNDLIR